MTLIIAAPFFEIYTNFLLDLIIVLPCFWNNWECNNYGHYGE